ncbi:MAG: hypothetical protein HY675_04030, partial [Chloroflexi bacterium]|nr:hypothetical protein [Chloroflexota bacterium]
MNVRLALFIVCLLTLSVLVLGGFALAAPRGDTPPDIIARGGQLYDSWVKAAGVAQPDGDQMLWSTQTTNTRAGKDTWR